MGKITEKVIKETYGLESITINGCILVPFYQVEDKLKKLNKIERIVNEEMQIMESDLLWKIKEVLENG